jgi:hypothetical protein
LKNILAKAVSAFLMFKGVTYAGPFNTTKLTLAWDPPRNNMDQTELTDLAGFKIQRYDQNTNLVDIIDVGNITTSTVQNLAQCSLMFFTATAYNTSRSESDYSEMLRAETGFLLDSISLNHRVVAKTSQGSTYSVTLATDALTNHPYYNNIVGIKFSYGRPGFAESSVTIPKQNFTDNTAYANLRNLQSDSTYFAQACVVYKLTGTQEVRFTSFTNRIGLALGTASITDTRDSDLDGMLDREEVIAGTDPYNNSSILKIRISSNPLRVEWDGKKGRTYHIHGVDLNRNNESLVGTVVAPRDCLMQYFLADPTFNFYKVLADMP